MTRDKKYAQGGLVAPLQMSPVDTQIRILRNVVPGLSVVSINNGRPEYLMSSAWTVAHPGQLSIGELAQSSRFSARTA